MPRAVYIGRGNRPVSQPTGGRSERTRVNVMQMDVWYDAILHELLDEPHELSDLLEDAELPAGQPDTEDAEELS